MSQRLPDSMDLAYGLFQKTEASEFLPALTNHPGYSAVSEIFQAVKKITSEIYSNTPEYRNVDDCEIPGHQYIEVRVVDAGAPEAVLSRHDAWHQQVARLSSEMKLLFRLYVEVD